MKLLGIDQGTTGTRACLVDAETLAIERQAYAVHAQIQPQPGWVEHDVLSDADLRARKRRTRIVYEPLSSDDERMATRERFATSLLAVRAGLRASS